MKCDFCSAPLLNGMSRHIVYGPKMAIVAAEANGAIIPGGWGSDDNWCACDDCHSKLLLKDYDSIIRNLFSGEGEEFFAVVRPLLMSMYSELVIMQ